MTYDDVTNVDSVGIVTARSGIVVVSGGATITGVSTFYSAVNVGTGITIDSASGIITATSLVKYGGTSAQYLMADGSTTEGDSLTKGYIAGLSAFLN